MERSRESRRSSMATGVPRRRHRTVALRDSSEDRAVAEASSKRGRTRDRDRDSSSRTKRRRGSHSHSTEEEEEEEEESFGNEQDDDLLQDAGISRMRYLNTNSDRNHRRSSTPSRPPPLLKVTDEMIGVPVPRKARSASVKRTNESCVSASGGGGEEQNFREQSSSSGRQSVEPASPSSSSVSARKKMKAIGAVAKTSKSGSSEIEIEIAELLYGLKTSKNHESSCPSKDVEKKKVEDYNPPAPVPNNSAAELVRIRSEQPVKVDCHDCKANGSSEPPKEDIEAEKFNSGAGYGGIAEENSCTKLDVDKQDSASTKVMYAFLEASNQRVGKFEIDLMAPPPMTLSPEGDDFSRADFQSETKSLAPNVEMKRESSSIMVERPGEIKKSQEEIEEAKMASFEEKRDVLKHDPEKPNNGDDIKTDNKLEEQDLNKQEHTRLSSPRVEKTAQPSTVPSSAAISGRPSSLSSMGYTPPLQTVVKMDKTTGPLTTPQHVNFVLSESQPKRCATHHYIARNIFLHQQLMKMNSHLPAAIVSSSLCGTKPNNVNCVPSAASMIIAKQSSKQLQGVNQNGAQEKGRASTSNPNITPIQSSNNANPMDSTPRMQLVLQQGSHPRSTGNLVHGPALLLAPGQHQASVAAATIQSGGVNSISSASSYSNCHSAAAGSLCTSSTLPAVAATMSFSYPKFSANDTPYVTVVQNNGYSFPFSTSFGPSAAIRGASPAQATHILNAPFYSSQIFHPLQHPQQHSHSQALIQPSHLNASTSSSSSHKQSQGVQVNGTNIFTSPPMKPHQSQKQQTSLSHPRKHETEVGGDSAPSVANKTSYPQNNVHGQNITLPVQPVNFSFGPSATSDIVGGNGGKFGDKHKQQQALKGGVEIIPSQAFAISFATCNGTSIPSNLNFSSMAQNPVIFHSLPDVAWQGYQAAGTSHTTQQKTYSITEGKSGGSSSHQDDEKKTTHGKSSSNGPTTLVFDNSSKNLNFISSPANGNWPDLSIASTAITSVPLSINASSSQQPSQLLQVQKQYGMQQQQPAMATQYKASTTNSTATKFGNNTPVFSQTVTHCKSSNQASHSRSSRKTTDSHVHQTSVMTSNTPTIKSFSQEQGRVSQGHMQISFAGNYITSLPQQGQQLLNNNQPLCTTVAASPRNGGNLKSNSEGKKVRSSGNTSQMQQTENSSAGSGQKSSPVCGRNVPSILSACPSHLSELKY